MGDERQIDTTRRELQATVWPPPPIVPFAKHNSGSHEENVYISLRFLNAAIFLFVAGCLLPFVLAVLSILAQHSPLLAFYLNGLRYAWPILYFAAIYFSIKAILLARNSKKWGIQVQGFIIVILSALFTFPSLYLILL